MVSKLKQIISLTTKLISIPSTSGNEKAREEILEYVLHLLKDFPIQRFEENGIKSALVSNRKNSKKFHIVLNVHLDVVPGSKEQYDAKIKNGKLYGRGAYDMKAAAAVEIIIFKELAKKLPYSIALQLVTDEEMGGGSGTRYQIGKGISADFVLAGEPTNLSIGKEAKGILSLEIAVKGVSAHAAHVWDGDNAVLRIINTVARIQEAFPIPKTPIWQTTANLAWIRTDNTTTNKVPDAATAWFDFRYVPDDRYTIREKIVKLLPKTIDYRIFAVEDGVFVKENDSFVQTLQKSIQKTMHKKVDFIQDHGSSDLRYYSRLGVPVVTFGPKGHGLHSDKEWVDIKSLEYYYFILKRLLFSV